jgi:uncharacterized membrane protein YedE/YeeE
MFESPSKLLLGLITGIVFGFLLQKGRVAKYNVIMGQFLLKDFTVMKTMGTAVAVGAVGIYAMQSAGMIRLEIKPAAFGSVILGAVLFGIGISIFGLCPGTSVAACGEGNHDAMVGVLGMFFGAATYVMLFSKLLEIGKALGDWGKVTLPQVTHTSPWLWVGPIAAAALVWYLIDRRRVAHLR